jgi:hypothetical protein
MQNIQDVENSKKIVTIKNEVSRKTEKNNLDIAMAYGDN